MYGLKLKMVPTNHAKNLHCFSILFSDSEGSYYYTGDTRDFKKLKEICLDKNFKRVYSEVARETYGVHIAYSVIKTLDDDSKKKLVLMHFSDIDIYNEIKKDGYCVAEIEE